MRKFYKTTKIKRHYQHRLQIESLETRNLLTVSLPNVSGPYLEGAYCGNTTISGGTLTIGGGGLTLDTGPHHAPSGADKAITVLPNTPYTLTVADFGFTDPDDSPADAFTKVKIKTLPTAGDLQLAGMPVTAGQFVNTADIAAGGLQFIPPSIAGAAVHPRIKFQVQDSGYASYNSVILDPVPKTLVFSLAANTAPVAHDDTYSVPKGGLLDEVCTTTRVQLCSQPGDPVGQGQTLLFDDAEYVFTVSTSDERGLMFTVSKPLGYHIDLSGPRLSFSAPLGDVLTAGVTYYNAQGPGAIDTPGITVTAGGVLFSKDCPLRGEFTVNQVEFGPSGELLKFDASFTQYASKSLTDSYGHIIFSTPCSAALTGRIEYNIPLTGKISLLQNDTDADGDPLEVVLVAGPQHGTLALDSDGGFRYTPEAGYKGKDTFQYKTSDVIAESNVATVSIDVLDFTKAPAGTSSVVGIPEGPSYILKVADFGFTDPNETPADDFTRVKITTLPTVGELTLSGVSVTAGQFIDVADIAAGNLVLAPPTGLPHASFTFQVEDSGSTEAGDANLDPDPKTLTFDVAPVAQDDAYTAKQNETLDEFVSVTHLHMVSELGDPIGGGQTYDNDGSDWTFSVTRDSQNGIQISLSQVGELQPGGLQIGTLGPTLYFATANGAELRPGTYTDVAPSCSQDTSKPRMYVSPNWGLRLILSPFVGQFTVNQVEYGASGEVLKFDATFEQHVANGLGMFDPPYNPAALTGRIQYHTDSTAVSLLQNDADADGDPLSVALVAGPQHGMLALMSDGGFSYTPAPGYSGVDTFQYKANDGLLDSNVATVSINVLPFGHAPQGTTSTVKVPPVNSYALKVADFGFTDPNDALADTFTGVKITTLPTGASLLLSGVPVTEGQLISVEAIAAGNLVLTPATGRPHINFTFQVEDSGSTEYGGTNLDPDPKTLTFNSPPVAQDDVYTINENEVLDNALLGNHLRVTWSNTWSPQFVSPIDADGSGGQCIVTQDGNTLTFTYSNNSGPYYGGCWVTFAAAGGVQLSAGVYDNPKETADADNPGLSFSWIFGNATNLTGQFIVNEAVYDTEGNILRFDATFSQQDLATGYFRTGRLQYNASAKLGTSVLENDTDADGDPLLVTPFQTLGGGGLVIGGSGKLVNGGGTIVIDGGGLIINPPILVQVYPQHGTLSLARDGGFIYTPNHNYYGPDSFRYSINDGTADSNVATVSISVVQVSQAPLGTTGVIKMIAGVPYVMQPADFGFSDPDDSPADTFTRVEFTTLPTSGTLALDGEPVFAGQFVAVDDIAAGKLIFTSEPGTPHPTCTFQVEDSGTINGGATLDPTPKKLTFDFTPVAQDDSFSVNENANLNADSSQSVLLNDSDADFDPLSAVLVAGPENGVLHLQSDGSFTYAPNAYFNGIDSFQYKINDGLLDSNVTTVTITVNHVSQAPSGASVVLNISAGLPHTLKIEDFGFSDQFDVPADSFTGVAITTLPTSGSLQLGDMSVTAGQFIAIADIDAGKLTFIPTTITTGYPHARFTFQVQDSGSTDRGGSIIDPTPKSITFNCIPVASNVTYTIVENGILDQSQFFSHLTMFSEPGDWIGGGSQYNFRNIDASFQAYMNYDNGVSISVITPGYGDWWYLNFAAPDDVRLVPGVYSAATRFPFQGGGPGLDISGDGRGSNDLTGQFTVLQVVYGPLGEILQFDATFEQHSEGMAPALTGRIQFHIPSPMATSILENDSDSDGDALSVNLVTAPQNGTLSLDSNGYFTYIPNHDFYGIDSFQYKANDGTIDGNVATVSINVLRKSSAPVGSSSTINVPSASSYTFSAADFGFSDPDDSPADTFTRVEFTTLPTSGTLALDGEPVFAGQFVAVDDIAAGKLIFTSEPGTPHPTCTFQVEDSGSTDRDGMVLDPVPKSITFNCIPGANDDMYNVFVGDGTADFNGDGTSDILWQNKSTGLVGIWIVRNGAYSSWSAIASADPSVWKVIGLGDFNGDGTSDILWQYKSTGLVGVWFVRNAVYSGWSALGSVDFSTWKLAGLGDFNGDGTSDILWQNQSTGLVGSWIIRNGAYHSWAPIASADLLIWKVAGIGDFNGDKTSDVLWQNQSTGLIGSWIVRNGAYSSWAPIASADLSVWKMTGIGDFNDDGTSDVLWQNQSTGLVGSWIVRNGAYSSWAGFASADPSVWNVAGIRDVNGDKTLDVLWHNQSTGLVGAWVIRNGAYSKWAGIASADPSVWKLIGRNTNVALLSAETEMPAPAASVHSLTQNDLQPLVDAAIGRWAAAGLDASTLAKLRQVKLAISDLHGSELAETEGNRITIDANAAGHGWFVDTTPDKDEEFILSPTNQLKTIDPQALDRIDLLSVVEHELGHVAGFDDLDSLAENVMGRMLGIGLRRIPS